MPSTLYACSCSVHPLALRGSGFETISYASVFFLLSLSGSLSPSAGFCFGEGDCVSFFLVLFLFVFCLLFFFFGGEGEVEGRYVVSLSSSLALPRPLSLLYLSLPIPSLSILALVPLSLPTLSLYSLSSLSLPPYLSLFRPPARPLARAFVLVPARVCLCTRTAMLPALSFLGLPAYVCALVSCKRLLSRLRRLPSP